MRPHLPDLEALRVDHSGLHNLFSWEDSPSDSNGRGGAVGDVLSALQGGGGGYKQVCWCPGRTATVHARQLCVCVCVCTHTAQCTNESCV